MTIDPSLIVTQEQYDAAVAKMLEESPDSIIVSEAPAGDVSRAEELLGVEPGTLADTVLRFSKGDERCLDCGRHFNVLDMLTAALRVHSSEFLKEVMFGDTLVAMTYEVGDGKAKTPVCAACGKRGPGAYDYKQPRYIWSK